MLKPQQTQRIYAMGAMLKLVENGNKNDLLHDLVYGITKKDSVRELTEQEYKDVVSELAQRLKIANIKEPPQKPYKTQNYQNSGRGKISDGQKRKIWQLMYKLQALDERPNEVKLGDRLCGIIKKELNIDALPRDPFNWLTYKNGVKLIEIIKKYCENAEKRRKECVGRKT